MRVSQQGCDGCLHLLRLQVGPGLKHLQLTHDLLDVLRLWPKLELKPHGEQLGLLALLRNFRPICNKFLYPHNGMGISGIQVFALLISPIFRSIFKHWKTITLTNGTVNLFICKVWQCCSFVPRFVLYIKVCYNWSLWQVFTFYIIIYKLWSEGHKSCHLSGMMMTFQKNVFMNETWLFLVFHSKLCNYQQRKKLCLIQFSSPSYRGGNRTLNHDCTSNFSRKSLMRWMAQYWAYFPMAMACWGSKKDTNSSNNCGWSFKTWKH